MARQSTARPQTERGKVGLTGLEPVTLRLSSACSNQLSYRPGKNFRFSKPETGETELTRPRLSAIRNPVSEINGGKGIRTPDFQLAKLALYQLSYAPALRIAECRLRIADFNPESFRD